MRRTHQTSQSSRMLTESRHSAAGVAISSVAPVTRSVPGPLYGLLRHNARIEMRCLPMFPVSGAEQLTASEAICPPRPRISAMNAYWDNVSSGTTVDPIHVPRGS